MRRYAIGAIVAMSALLGGCQRPGVEYAYESVGTAQRVDAYAANTACGTRATAAQRAFVTQNPRGGNGQPAYDEAYAACMTEMGWRRVPIRPPT